MKVIDGPNFDSWVSDVPLHALPQQFQLCSKCLTIVLDKKKGGSPKMQYWMKERRPNCVPLVSALPLHQGAWTTPSKWYLHFLMRMGHLFNSSQRVAFCTEAFALLLQTRVSGVVLPFLGAAKQGRWLFYVSTQPVFDTAYSCAQCIIPWKEGSLTLCLPVCGGAYSYPRWAALVKAGCMLRS